MWGGDVWLRPGFLGSVHSQQADMPGWLPCLPLPSSSSLGGLRAPALQGRRSPHPGPGAAWGVGRSVELWAMECQKPGKETWVGEREGR